MKAFKHEARGQELEKERQDLMKAVGAEDPNDEGKRRSARNRNRKEAEKQHVIESLTMAEENWKREAADLIAGMSATF